MTERPIQVNQNYYEKYLTVVDKENEEKHADKTDKEKQSLVEKYDDQKTKTEEQYKELIHPWWPKKEKSSRVSSWFSKTPDELSPDDRFKDIEFDEDKTSFWVPMMNKENIDGKDVWVNRGKVRI